MLYVHGDVRLIVFGVLSGAYACDKDLPPLFSLLNGIKISLSSRNPEPSRQSACSCVVYRLLWRARRPLTTKFWISTWEVDFYTIVNFLIKFLYHFYTIILYTLDYANWARSFHPRLLTKCGSVPKSTNSCAQTKRVWNNQTQATAPIHRPSPQIDPWMSYMMNIGKWQQRIFFFNLSKARICNINMYFNLIKAISIFLWRI